MHVTLQFPPLHTIGLGYILRNLQGPERPLRLATSTSQISLQGLSKPVPFLNLFRRGWYKIQTMLVLHRAILVETEV